MTDKTFLKTDWNIIPQSEHKHALNFSLTSPVLAATDPTECHQNRNSGSFNSSNGFYSYGTAKSALSKRIYAFVPRNHA